MKFFTYALLREPGLSVINAIAQDPDHKMLLKFVV